MYSMLLSYIYSVLFVYTINIHVSLYQQIRLDIHYPSKVFFFIEILKK